MRRTCTVYLSGYGRIIVTGTLPGACYTGGMTSFLFSRVIRIFDFKGGFATRELAPLKKTIYSQIDLREILLGCNHRYLAFLSSLDDPSAGERDLRRLSQPRVGSDPSVKGVKPLCLATHLNFNRACS